MSNPVPCPITSNPPAPDLPTSTSASAADQTVTYSGAATYNTQANSCSGTRIAETDAYNDGQTSFGGATTSTGGTCRPKNPTTAAVTRGLRCSDTCWRRLIKAILKTSSVQTALMRASGFGSHILPLTHTRRGSSVVIVIFTPACKTPRGHASFRRTG